MYRRLVVAGALMLALVGLWTSVWGGTSLPTPNGSSDPALYAAVIQRVRGGEGYYPAMGTELVARGYPTASVFNWRLPTLTMFQSRLPAVQFQAGLVLSLGLVAAFSWMTYLRPRTTRAWVTAVGCLVLTLPVWPLFSPPSVLLHDLWAGQLIAFSLALWANRHPYQSAVVAALAVTLREQALMFTVVMSAAGFLERRPREGWLWVAVCVVGFVAILGHALMVLRYMPPESITGRWLSFGGWPFVLITTRVNVVLMQAHGALVAVAAPVALAGLLLWPGAAGRRAAAVAIGFTAVFLLVGRPDNWYWGLLTSPLLPLGVAGVTCARTVDDLPNRRLSL
jgi:hypothetical protein